MENPRRGTFYAHLSESFPSQINFDVTMFCNLKCTHCPYELVNHRSGRDRQNMPFSIHKKAVDEISNEGRGKTRYIRYSGDGEPLIHPKLEDLVSYCWDKLQLPINLTTNGSFLTREKAISLFESGVKVIDVSIDAATPSTYEKVRVGGNFEQVVTNTNEAISASSGYPKTSVVVSFVKQNQNYTEVKQFKDYWERQGVRQVIIRNSHSAAGAIENKALELWASAPKERTACLYPWERLVIKSDGEITYCPVDWHHQAGVGNILVKSLKEIWDSKELFELRKNHANGILDDKSQRLCLKCPDWSVINWPHENATYASLMHELEN